MASEHYISSYRDLAINAIEDLKNYSNDEGPERLMVSYRGYTKDLERLDNTRPAPAATDTGLVTVGNITEECLLELKQMLCGEIHPCNDIGDVTDADIELVTRSQAEEILAAERAEKEEWKQLHGAAEKVAKERADDCNNLHKLINKLDDDNAAKDARINFLEHLVKEQETQITNGEALEAKLAAAEKALTVFLSEYDELYLFCDEPASMVSAVDAARAVLGGKPS